MGLLGGSSGDVTSSSSSYMTRPQYVEDFINEVTQYANELNPVDWINKEYAGLNQWEQDALNKMTNSNMIDNLTQGLERMGQSGSDMLSQALTGMQSLWQQGPITAQDITNEANQLYDEQAVQGAQTAANNQIYSQTGATMAQHAQSNLNQGAYTSGAANQRNTDIANATSSIGTTDSAIANQAWTQALKEGAGLLTGQRSLEQGALSGLMKLGKGEMNQAFTGANAAMKGIDQEFEAGLIEQMNQQNQDNMNYFNQKGNQNIPWYYANEMLKLAGVLNTAEGTNRTTNTSTSTSGGGLF